MDTARVNILPENILGTPIYIFGVGATGSTMLELLVKMGFTNLYIADFDTVDEHNLTNQNYTLTTLGMEKTQASAALIKNRYGLDINILAHDHLDMGRDIIVFNCIDSKDGRDKIQELYNDNLERCMRYVETFIGEDAFSYIMTSGTYVEYTRGESQEVSTLSLCGGRVTLPYIIYNCCGAVINDFVMDLKDGGRVTSYIKTVSIRNGMIIRQELEC